MNKNKKQNTNKEETNLKLESSSENYAGAIIGVSLFILMAIICYVILQPVEFETHCTFNQWKPMPTGETWENPITHNQMTMYPEYTSCGATGKLPLFLINKLGE